MTATQSNFVVKNGLNIGTGPTQISSGGTITSATWNGSVISPTYGGTGVNNGSNTLTLNGSYTLNQSVASGASPTFNSIGVGTSSPSSNGYLYSTYLTTYCPGNGGYPNIRNVNVGGGEISIIQQASNNGGFINLSDYTGNNGGSAGLTIRGLTGNGVTEVALSYITANTHVLNCTGDVVAYYSSDIRLKENIETISNALNKISQLDGITFNWNNTAKEFGKDTNLREAGVIAQQVQEVLPEIVTERENGYLAVKYEKLVPLLIEAIKELKNEVDELKAKLNS